MSWKKLASIVGLSTIAIALAALVIWIGIGVAKNADHSVDTAQWAEVIVTTAALVLAFALFITERRSHQEQIDKQQEQIDKQQELFDESSKQQTDEHREQLAQANQTAIGSRRAAERQLARKMRLDAFGKFLLAADRAIKTYSRRIDAESTLSGSGELRIKFTEEVQETHSTFIAVTLVAELSREVEPVRSLLEELISAIDDPVGDEALYRLQQRFEQARQYALDDPGVAELDTADAL